MEYPERQALHPPMVNALVQNERIEYSGYSWEILDQQEKTSSEDKDCFDYLSSLVRNGNLEMGRLLTESPSLLP